MYRLQLLVLCAFSCFQDDFSVKIPEGSIFFTDELDFQGFTVEENVVLQSTAVATATMPLTAGYRCCPSAIATAAHLFLKGFVGIIPAISLYRQEDYPLWVLVLWTLSVAFFGVFFAVPLRRQAVCFRHNPVALNSFCRL